MDQLRKSIEYIISITDSEFEHFQKFVQIKTFKRKELLLKSGDVCKSAFFVLEGCMRYFYLKDGEEITGQFFFENSWYTDYASFISKRPSNQNIQALEKTTVVVLPKVEMDKIFVEIPKFEKFGRLMAENAFLGLRDKTELHTNLSAEERYVSIITNRPKVIERIPQHYIASYLGIRAPSLSRIRQRLLNNDD